jgi:hypothetical protein
MSSPQGGSTFDSSRRTTIPDDVVGWVVSNRRKVGTRKKNIYI